MMFLYRIFALSISMDVIGSALVSQTVQYETMNKAPDSSSLIGSISSTSIIEMCLIRCSNKVDCKSVVYEDSKCRLYNTTNDSSVLTTGQRAVSLIRRKSSYGKVLSVPSLCFTLFRQLLLCYFVCSFFILVKLMENSLHSRCE